MAPGPIQIKLRCASWQQLSAIYKRDLARSAVFLKSSNPPPLGVAVQVNLTLPTDSLVVLKGTVAAHVPDGGLGGRGPGIDIALHSVPQSAMWLIESALASRRDERAQAAPPPLAPPTGGLPPTSTVGAIQARSRAAPPPVEINLEDGDAHVAAESDLLQALGDELESLNKLNPFQVLGVGYGATDDEVRLAFGELTKRYHPDRYARYQSGQVHHIASEIFILIRDAYRRLGDTRSRLAAKQSIEQKRAPTVVGIATMPTQHQQRPLPLPPPPPARDTPPPVPAAAARAPVAPPRSPPAEPSFVDLELDLVDGAPLDLVTDPRPGAAAPGAEKRSAGDYGNVDALLDAGKYDVALAVFKMNSKRNPSDRHARAGIELAEGLKALAQRDRLEAAQRFEVVLELDPGNERAARELAEMRRQATNERKGLLSRLLGKKE